MASEGDKRYEVDSGRVSEGWWYDEGAVLAVGGDGEGRPACRPHAMGGRRYHSVCFFFVAPTGRLVVSDARNPSASSAGEGGEEVRGTQVRSRTKLCGCTYRRTLFSSSSSSSVFLLSLPFRSPTTSTCTCKKGVQRCHRHDLSRAMEEPNGIASWLAEVESGDSAIMV